MEDRPTLSRVGPWLLLLGSAAAWRCFQWSHTVALFNDGPLFLAQAEAWSAGHVSDALAEAQHPLYPLAVAALHGIGLDWETAGVAVSVIGGTAALGFVALFLRDAFGERAMWLGAAILTVHSRFVEYTSDVQSDGLYLGLFAAGIWTAWRAIERRNAVLAALAGVVAGLAYLTRPEGLGVALVLAAWACGAWLCGRWSAGEAWRVTAAVTLAAGLVAAPYVFAISHGTGRIALTQKKTLHQLTGIPAALAPAPVSAVIASVAPTAPAAAAPPAAAPPTAAPPAATPPPRGDDGLAVIRAHSPPARAYAATKMLARTMKSAFRYGPLALLVIGLAASWGRPSRRGAFLLVLLGFYTAVLLVFTFEVGYVSRRHALPPLLPLFGYAALGAGAIGAWIDRIAPGRRGRERVVAAAVVAAVALGEAAGQLAPRRAEDGAAVAAATWLREHAAPAPLITDRLRLGYYAGMPYVPFVQADDTALRSFFDRAMDPALGPAGARYVLLDDPEDVAAAQRAAGKRLRLLHRVEEGGRQAWVFERIEPAVP